MALVTRTLISNNRTNQKLQNQIDDQAKQLQDFKTKTLQQQQKQINDLKTQVQARVEAKQNALAEAARAAVAVVAPQPVYATTSPSDACPSDPKGFIYCHESGNNPSAMNAGSGACGLGQALPCTKMPCKLGDYNCQDLWFTAYAVARYGGWSQAKVFWQVHYWW